jgi:hypothetical protein
MTDMAGWKARIKEIIKKIDEDKYEDDADLLEDLEGLIEEIKSSMDEEDE